MSSRFTTGQAISLLAVSRSTLFCWLACYRKDYFSFLEQGNKGKEPHNALPNPLRQAIKDKLSNQYLGFSITISSKVPQPWWLRSKPLNDWSYSARNPSFSDYHRRAPSNLCPQATSSSIWWTYPNWWKPSPLVRRRLSQVLFISVYRWCSASLRQQGFTQQRIWRGTWL